MQYLLDTNVVSELRKGAAKPSQVLGRPPVADV
jgi:predicted nucleic acid-binding protein